MTGKPALRVFNFVSNSWEKECRGFGNQPKHLVPYINFSKQRASKDGLNTICLTCDRDRHKASYAANPEKAIASSKAWQAANSDKVSSNKAEYYNTNREELIRKSCARIRFKLDTDPLFKLIRNLRTRTLEALKGHTKSAKTLELLGCTAEFFHTYIESLFKPGMTWENQGTAWHDDHIKPFAAFDNLDDPAQQREVCHYTNHRPEWGSENMSRGCKIAFSDNPHYKEQ
jgi:hypothetical protein